MGLTDPEKSEKNRTSFMNAAVLLPLMTILLSTQENLPTIDMLTAYNETNPKFDFFQFNI